MSNSNLENNHIVHYKEFDLYWKKHLAHPKKVLYILGEGFDPRTTQGITKFINTIPIHTSLDVTSIHFDEGNNSESKKYTSNVTDNKNTLTELINNAPLNQRISFNEHILLMWKADGGKRRRVSSQNAIKYIRSIENISIYTDIIVDISAFPRSLYISLIVSLIKRVSRDNKPYIHVIVSENHQVDSQIQPIGIDEEASAVQGFIEDVESESIDSTISTNVWMPLIGEGEHERLNKIHDSIGPIEICPILPSPSVNPRRADNIIIEHHTLLFDIWNVEPGNIIYASEQNPYDVYRQIIKASMQYYSSLKPLGDPTIILSALSSKLMSLGMILAAVHLKSNGKKVSIYHVEANGYVMKTPNSTPSTNHEGNIFSLLINGDSL
jgi:hypothetical protein